tara:strand:- start:892 stop:1710 length:819 start_codon:yes stop_codon:yes gene_type:complete
MPYMFGQLNDIKAATAICNKLKARGIAARFTQVDDGSFALLVDREEDVATAHDFFRVSMGMPPRFEIPPEAIAMSKVPFGQASGALILICVCVSVLTYFGDPNLVRSWLMISLRTEGLPEIMDGQWWRLFTPAIVHFGFLHLIFNMMWLKSLGSLIEHVRGKNFLLLLVLSSAAASNLLQWYFDGPMFGGMSGVVYALLGFLWMVKHFNPAEEYSLPKQDVWMMIGWFFLCLTGLLGPIANYAHGGGLVFGMMVGAMVGKSSAGSVGAKKLE